MASHRCSVSGIDLASGLPSLLSDAWGMPGSVVTTWSSSWSSHLVTSKTRSTCSSKAVSSESKAALSSASVKLWTSTWCCSNSRSCSLASSLKRLIFYSSEGVNTSFSSSLPIFFCIQVRRPHTLPWLVFALAIVSAMVWLVQSYSQSECSLRLSTIWFKGTVFVPGLSFLLIPVWFIQVPVNAFHINIFQPI